MKILELLYRNYIQNDFYRCMMRYHFKKEESLNVGDETGRYWYHHYKRRFWNELLNLNNEKIENLRMTI